MPYPKKASDAELLAAYAEMKNVWRVGKHLGMCGQSVHERLSKLNAIANPDAFTAEDEARIRADYARHADAGRLGDLAAAMGRTKPNLCRKARAMGLTNKRRGRPYSAEATGQRMREWHANHEHPRGMLGKTHGAKVRRAVSEASSKRWAAMDGEARAQMTLRQMMARAASHGNLAFPKPHGSWKAAWREIGGKRCYFRSRWEANYARYLQWLKERQEIVEWEHEPETFWFEKVKRGTRSFLPDFRVTERSGVRVYHEVKGWMDDRSKTKIKRMRIYHPSVKLIVVEKRAYHSIQAKVSRLVVGWETDRSQTPGVTAAAIPVSICQMCGKAFQRHVSKAARPPKFCSKRCAGKGVSLGHGENLSEPIPCARCGKLFKRRSAKGKMCSRECQVAAMVARVRSRSTPLPTCCDCGANLHRHDATRCRKCWKANKAGKPVVAAAPLPYVYRPMMKRRASA